MVEPQTPLQKFLKQEQLINTGVKHVCPVGQKLVKLLHPSQDALWPLANRLAALSLGAWGGSGSPRGDLVHLLSGACPALAPTLASTLHHTLDFLSPYPLIISTIHNALLREPQEFVSFLLDPSTNTSVIPLAQQHRREVLVPLFRFSRARGLLNMYLWNWKINRGRFLVKYRRRMVSSWRSW